MWWDLPVDKIVLETAAWTWRVSEVKVAQLCLTFCDRHRLLCPLNSPGQDTGVGSRSLFQGIFPTQELNHGLLPCWWILYQLSYQGLREDCAKNFSMNY